MSRLLVAVGTLILATALGCDGMRARDQEIDAATRAIAAAGTDAARADAYSRRGRAYSEKARYARAFKKITPEDYARLFALALADHDRAVKLAPANAALYLDRGLSYYDRASLEDQGAPGTRGIYDAAKADFTLALDRDARNVRAIDMRGLVQTSEGNHDEAIADFARERELDPKAGTLRLADAYCRRGQSRQLAKTLDPAIADYEKSLEVGGAVDACECQPLDPLVALLTEKRDYDRAWAAVRKARAAKRPVAPGVLEQLEKASGRTG